MRQSTTFKSNLANGNYMALAASLNTLNYATASNPTLPVIPARVQGSVLRHNGFPENFIVTNPQFGAVNLMTNNFSNNYHSLNAQVTLRPVHGVSTQSTYTWSKNLGAGFPGADRLGQVFTDPLDRHADYAVLAGHARARLPHQRNVRAADSDPTSSSSVTARELWRESSRVGR